MKVTIAFTKGGFDPPRDVRVRIQTRDDVAHHEYSPEVQSRKEGRFSLTLDEENRVVGEVLVGAEAPWFSPLIGDISWDQFPEGFAFGNGTSTCEIPLRKPDGTIVPTWLNWCVFPMDTDLSEEKLYRLREIFEGIPPGNPERNVWREFPPEEAKDRVGIPDSIPSKSDTDLARLQTLRVKRDRTTAENKELLDLLVDRVL